MYKERLCRVCLAGKVKMYSISDGEMQELYEKLTNEKVKKLAVPSGFTRLSPNPVEISA